MAISVGTLLLIALAQFAFLFTRTSGKEKNIEVANKTRDVRWAPLAAPAAGANTMGLSSKP